MAGCMRCGTKTLPGGTCPTCSEELAALRADNDRLIQAFMKRCLVNDALRAALDVARKALEEMRDRGFPGGFNRTTASRALTDIAALTGSPRAETKEG